MLFLLILQGYSSNANVAKQTPSSFPFYISVTPEVTGQVESKVIIVIISPLHPNESVFEMKPLSFIVYFRKWSCPSKESLNGASEYVLTFKMSFFVFFGELREH